MNVSVLARPSLLLNKYVQSAAWWLAPVLIWLAFVLPAHPDEYSLSEFAHFPIELLLSVWLFMTPVGRKAWFRYTFVAFLVTLMVLRLADVGSYIAFDRAFSPLVEWHLLGDGWNLASSTVGRPQAALVVSLVVVLLLSIVGLLNYSLHQLACIAIPLRRRIRQLSVVLIAVFLPLLAAKHYFERDWPISAGIFAETVWRVKAMRMSIADQTEFIQALREDSVLKMSPPLFSALNNLDVLVLFVESYGRSFVDLEPMRTTALRRLSESQRALTTSGLSVKSGWVESPIRGGRSWLAHSTFMSGLLVNNQARFDRLISSERLSLNRLFAKAGWHTAGLMPAIQFDWPESRWYGFDTLLAARDFNYQGEPFGWVTMPDQFTLSALQTLRDNTTQPLMAEVALITSHVPWTPIPEVLPWEIIGDGHVFDGKQRDEPRIDWKDRPGVQALYNRTLDYSLQVITEYMIRHADDALFVVIGDHQPTSIIDGWGKTADVPVHIVSNNPALLERLPDEHFSPGMIPTDTQLSLPMQDVRQLFSTLFENP